MTNTEKNADSGQIEAVMRAYIEGGRTGSVETLRPIFHELATICGYVGPDLFAGPIEMFYDWHAENGPAADLVTGDMRIDVEGSAASVRIELDNWTGHRFTDFFTLVKIEGQWQIMTREPLSKFARARRAFAGVSGLAWASVAWSFQMSEPKQGGGPAKARPVGFRRRSRISHVAPLGRSYGYCHSRRTARSAASPTETRSVQTCSEVPRVFYLHPE